MTNEELEKMVSDELAKAFSSDCIKGLDTTWGLVVSQVTSIVVEACAEAAGACDGEYGECCADCAADRVRKLGGTP